METRKFNLTLTTEFLGTVPKDPEIYQAYIESKKPVDQLEDESLTVEKIEEKGWTGFHKDDNGLFIYEYMPKGFLKQAGNVLKDIVSIKALKSKLDDFVFISPRKIYLGQNEPDGVNERSIRVLTAQGPRVALVKSDYIDVGKVIEIEITLIPHKEIKWKTIETLLDYGKLQGLGQFRNGGYGRFNWQCVQE